MLCFSAAATAQDSVDKGGLSHETIETIDLTASFHTRAKWTFVVTQEADEQHPDIDLPGSVHFCFVREDKLDRDCARPAGFNTVHRVEVADPATAPRNPLLIVIASNYVGASGSGTLTTMFWRYRAKSDKFEQIFWHASNANNNEETRFMTKGPLAGDIVISIAPRKAPYHYGIEVHRPTKSGDYVRILKFTGKTRLEIYGQDKRGRWQSVGRNRFRDAENRDPVIFEETGRSPAYTPVEP